MRHPLTLRLVAQAYTGQHLPDRVDDDQLVQLLFDSFIEHGRLQRADVRFLEDELMPLMIAPGHWSNAITAEQIAGARASDGRRLLTPGEPGPLTRLADAGLLATTNARLSDPLRFAHERFYEHFARQRLRRLHAASPDARRFYLELASAPAFLFSPARQLLAEEITRQPIEWLVDLARGLTSPTGHLLLIGALEHWGQSHPQAARACLERLWAIGQPRLARVFSRFGLLAPEPPLEWLRIQRTVVAAAGALDDHDLLIRSLLTGSPTVQHIAVGKVLALWRADRAAGQRILAEISQHVTGRLGLPNLAACLAFLQLVSVFLFEVDQPAEAKALVDSQIRAVIRRVFGWPWRTLLLRGVIGWLVSMWEQRVRDNGVDGSFDSVFRLPPEQWQHLEAIALLLDHEAPWPGLAAAREHVFPSLNTGTYLATWFTTMPLSVRIMRGESEARAVLINLLQEACETQPPQPWAIFANWAAGVIVEREPHPDLELWAAFDRCISSVIDSYPHWHESYRATRLVPPQRLVRPAQTLAGYFRAREIAGLRVEEGLVWATVIRQIETGNVAFILDYLYDMRVLAQGLFSQPRLALRLIRPMLACADESVQRALADLLARLRQVAVEDVNELLAAPDAPTELADLARAWQVEDVTSDLMEFGVWALVYRLMFESSAARKLVSNIFSRASHFTNTRAWMAWGAQLILNTLAGEDLFPVDMPGH